MRNSHRSIGRWVNRMAVYESRSACRRSWQTTPKHNATATAYWKVFYNSMLWGTNSPPVVNCIITSMWLSWTTPKSTRIGQQMRPLTARTITGVSDRLVVHFVTTSVYFARLKPPPGLLLGQTLSQKTLTVSRVHSIICSIQQKRIRGGNAEPLWRQRHAS